MNIKTELLRADGFNEVDIQQIQDYCDQALAAGRFSHDAALIQTGTGIVWCCRTIAEILDKLRPGCWLDKPSKRKKARQKKAKSPVKSSDGQIKVHYTFPRSQRNRIGGEYAWVRPLSKNTAKVESIPFGTGRLACGDLIRFDKNYEIKDILEHVAKSRLLRYADPDQQTEEELAQCYGEVRDELKQYDIYTEGMFPGVCSISVPNDIEDDELESIADRLDASVIVHDDEDE